MSDWGNEQPNEADFEIPIEDIDPGDIDTSGQVNRDGWYHFEVAAVKPELETVSEKGGSKTPSIRFDCLVLESVKNQSPSGSVLFHRVWVGGKDGAPVSDGSRKMMLKWALGLGLIAKTETGFICTETKQPLKGLPVALWMRAVGVQFVARVEAEENNRGGKDYRIPFSTCYQVDDPQVADVPKSKAALALIGKQSAAPAATKAPAKSSASKPSASKQAASTTNAPAAAPAESALDLSDL